MKAFFYAIVTVFCINEVGAMDRYTPEQQPIADHIIRLERAALDKWFRGDSSGYQELWSKKNFSYFDGVFRCRVDTHKEITEFVKSVVDGKLYAEKYKFCNPRIQFGTDMAVLTYQLHANTSLIEMHYNCVEVFQKEEDDWHVIHSTWSFIRPMDLNFSSVKKVV